MRRSLATVLALCFFAALPVMPARAAAPPLPASGTILVPGHGWGHGRGMGQWGAKGMADAGKTFSEIVGHYYSDVNLGERSASESIRVLVEQSSDVVVTADDVFTVIGSTGSTLATSSDDFPFIRVKYDGSQYRYEKAPAHTGPWSLIRTSAAYGIFKRGARLLQLVFATGGVRYYRGSIIARYSSARGMMAINELLMQEYLYGVVPRESPASWHAEALKSQAVAARTYSAYKKDYQRSKGYAFDICATTACQVYGGYAYKTCMMCARQDLEYSSTNNAINATAGKVLLYDGKPILAEFSSSTGGYTAQGNVPYQKAVPDGSDSVSPHHEWQAKITVDDVQKKWPQIGKLIEINVLDRNGFGEWGGRVGRLELVGTLDTIIITGSAWRSAFEWPSRSNGVRSTWFTVLYWNGELVSAPSSISIPSGETATLPVQVRNTGNVKWPVGGSVRIATGSPSRFAGSDWISETRAASVARNVTDPAKTYVRGGEVAEFRIPVSTEGIAPGSYTQTFTVIADGYSTMNPSFGVRIQVLASWTDEAPNLATNGSFERGIAGWTKSGTTSADTYDGADARDGARSLRVTGGGGTKTVSQTIAFAGGAGRRFTVAGWNRSTSTRATGGPIELRAVVGYTDGTRANVRLAFPKAAHAWEYAESSFGTNAGKQLASITMTAVVQAQTGTTWFDAVRLTENPIVNGSFEHGLFGWTASDFAAGDGAATDAARDGVRSLRVAGSAGSKRATAAVPLRGRATDRFLLEVWTKAAGTTPAAGRLDAVLTLKNADGTITEHTMALPTEPHDWALSAAVVAAPKSFHSASLALTVEGQTGSVWLDGARITRSWTYNPSLEGALEPWTGYGFGPGDGLSSTAVRGGVSSARLTGSGRQGVRQEIALAGGAGGRFVVSALHRAAGTSVGGGLIGLVLGFRNTDGTTSWVTVPFARSAHDWTYTEASVRAPKRFSRADLYAVFYDQTGSVYLDGITLRRP